MLGVAVTQPLFASVSDVLGRKGPLYFSILLFAVGSIVFALARDMTTIIAGRVVQGLGGGGLDVLQEMIVVDMTTLKERPLYLALMALPTATGSILGPVIGALLSEYASWRWIGWINLPFLAPGLLLPPPEAHRVQLRLEDAGPGLGRHVPVQRRHRRRLAAAELG